MTPMNEDVPAEVIADLHRRISRLMAGSNRVIIGVVGEPGAGKSTLTAALSESLTNAKVSNAVVPMDGFHLANTELARLGRTERKGAIDTFDGGGYLSLLRRLRSADESVVYAPMYMRGQLESSIGSAIPVARETAVVLTEGNYLLADLDPWWQVPGLLDEAWFIDVDTQVRRARLYARHVANGKTPERAEQFAYGSDEVNAELVRGTRSRADVVVPWR